MQDSVDKFQNILQENYHYLNICWLLNSRDPSSWTHLISIIFSNNGTILFFFPFVKMHILKKNNKKLNKSCENTFRNAAVVFFWEPTYRSPVIFPLLLSEFSYSDNTPLLCSISHAPQCLHLQIGKGISQLQSIIQETVLPIIFTIDITNSMYKENGLKEIERS